MVGLAMRLFFRGRYGFAFAAIAGALCGCSPSQNNANSGMNTQTVPVSTSNTPSSTSSPKSPASQNANSQFQVEALPTSGSSSANWGADKGEKSKSPSFERGRLLSRGGGAGGGTQAPPVDPYAARYSKDRLEKAAVIRNYASVSVMPVGIDAFVKTAWTSGMVHIRLALLGPLDNLKTFNRTQNDVKLTFQDHAGNPLQVIIVPMSEMKEAPPSTNFGTPTYVVEGSMECPLELYEEYYQWMFEWE
jgi:hypothetical protein